MSESSFWVSETGAGYGNTVEVTATLCDIQSEFQHIQIFETRKLGRMLMLDGIIQLTEFDEFAYQEMMTHPALQAHPAPKRVLIVGGGDGGVAREVARHPEVERIDQCEIDGQVVAMARKFLPGMACGFDDPRMNLHIGDGLEFVKAHHDEFDVVIVDSTDPVGPGEALFGAAFYESVHQALRADGIVCSQAESIFLFPEIVRRLYGFTERLFRYNGYGMIAVPTYPTGSIGFCMGSKAARVDEPGRALSPALAASLRYYTPAVHRAAFQLPAFAARWFAGGRPAANC